MLLDAPLLLPRHRKFSGSAFLRLREIRELRIRPLVPPPLDGCGLRLTVPGARGGSASPRLQRPRERRRRDSSPAGPCGTRLCWTARGPRQAVSQTGARHVACGRLPAGPASAPLLTGGPSCPCLLVRPWKASSLEPSSDYPDVPRTATVPCHRRGRCGAGLPVGERGRWEALCGLQPTLCPGLWGPARSGGGGPQRGARGAQTALGVEARGGHQLPPVRHPQENRQETRVPSQDHTEAHVPTTLGPGHVCSKTQRTGRARTGRSPHLSGQEPRVRISPQGRWLSVSLRQGHDTGHGSHCCCLDGGGGWITCLRALAKPAPSPSPPSSLLPSPPSLPALLFPPPTPSPLPSSLQKAAARELSSPAVTLRPQSPEGLGRGGVPQGLAQARGYGKVPCEA